MDRIPADVGEDRRGFIKWLLKAEADAFLTIKPVTVNAPDAARTKDSAPCTACGESTTLTHLREVSGEKLCIPCAKKRVSGSR